MNFGVLSNVIGNILMILSVLIVPSIGVSIYHRGLDLIPLVFTAILTLGVGIVLKGIKPKEKNIKTKDALLIVVLGWITVSIFGAIPFLLSGVIASPIDAIFEVVSGFTTTGSTILTDIESLPNGLLFWRSSTHWIGGMGILVFTLALLPSLGIGGFQIFKAESPGPVASKITPKMVDTAKSLYKIYILITVVLFVLLFVGGMNFEDAAIHTFGVVGTGGFSNKNASVAHFDSTYIHIVISVFMVICGTNFGLFYNLFNGKKGYFKYDDEFKAYIKIIGFAIVLISINLFFTVYDKSLLAVRDATFQATSIISTSGFVTADYDLWPTFSKFILFILMIIGSSAGSTAGGLKIIRIVVIFRIIKKEIIKVVHKRAVVPVKINGKNLDEETVSGITAYLGMYFICMLIGTAIISLEQIDLMSAISTSITALSNVGPGFGMVGATANFAWLSNLSKITMTLLMLLGRLEFFTIVVLLAPRSWRRGEDN
ncbi:MAG: TrkH family potassium uptake protein [Tissierellia bacterium]|nr:TrkH family potassium uptake protein [Tissierellia bacterium]